MLMRNGIKRHSRGTGGIEPPRPRPGLRTTLLTLYHGTVYLQSVRSREHTGCTVPPLALHGCTVYTCTCTATAVYVEALGGPTVAGVPRGGTPWESQDSHDAMSWVEAPGETCERLPSTPVAPTPAARSPRVEARRQAKQLGQPIERRP
jgi:hypothetical protein